MQHFRTSRSVTAVGNKLIKNAEIMWNFYFHFYVSLMDQLSQDTFPIFITVDVVRMITKHIQSQPHWRSKLSVSRSIRRLLHVVRNRLRQE